MSGGPIQTAVAATLAELGPGMIGVGCSGGADSIALADVTITLAGPSRVAVLVIDHALTPASGEVAAGVAAWARSRGATASVRRVEVERRASIEAAARAARYAAFAELADELDLVAILLGHTARDQAETVLMRILRGTGPAGLVGIPARRDRFVRPLLAIERARIDAHVGARGLPVWHDPMNDDPAITRVRVRTELLPLLRRENAQLDAALIRLADSAGEWLAVIDAAAEPFARLPIDCAALAGQPAAIRKRAIVRALAATPLDCDAVHLDAIDNLVTAPTRGTIELDVPNGRIVRTYDALDLAKPGTGPGLQLGKPGTGPSFPAEVAISSPPGYQVRPWQPGDRMQPARLAGHSRKLSDLYVDAKIPRTSRAAARVLVRESDGTIVWAEHVGIAHDSVLLDEERGFATFIPAQSGGSF